MHAGDNCPHRRRADPREQRSIAIHHAPVLHRRQTAREIPQVRPSTRPEVEDVQRRPVHQPPRDLAREPRRPGSMIGGPAQRPPIGGEITPRALPPPGPGPPPYTPPPPPRPPNNRGRAP